MTETFIKKCTPKRFMNFLIRHGVFNWLPDKPFLKMAFKIKAGRRLDLKNPETFNEKLQWIKLYNRNPLYTVMVDKYAVREYIKEKIGEKYLVPLLNVWDNADDIDFDSLPDQFVLKCNHNSGGLCICRDKSKLDFEDARKKLKKSLNTNFYIKHREWPYKDVPRKIICEKCMTDESGTELKDYKVLCFNGEPKLVQIHRGRYKNHTQDYYDTDWNHLDILQGCPMSDIKMDRPEFLDDMLALSKKLSKDIPMVRVDWYYVDGQLYFGELTFFDASGFDDFEPQEYNKLLGSWITLPKR